MKLDQVIIFAMVGAILFSTFALGLAFITQSDETSNNTSSDQLKDSSNQSIADSQNQEAAAKACEPSQNALSNNGNPEGQWPFTTNSVTSLQTEDVRIGGGQAAQIGDCITVHYRLALTDGTPVAGNNTFGSRPISFTLQPGSLIEGWIQGIPGLREGGLRRLIVPPSLGYGEADTASIPGGSTLIFEVELVKIEQRQE